MNQELYNFFHNLNGNPVIEKIAYLFSYQIGYSLPIILLIYLMIKKQRIIKTFAIIFSAGFLAWFSALVSKLIFKIPRPITQYNFFDIAGYSFPSTHTTIYTALAFAFAVIEPRLKIPMFIIVILVGISRIVLGVHTPIDIIGGLILGSLVGLFISKKFKNL